MTRIQSRNAYIKTEWQNNVTVVDAEKLNKIEDALESAKESTLNNQSEIDKKFDSAIKEGNRVLFLSKGTKVCEVDLSSLLSSGPMGPQGPQGPQGANGITPNIQIGQVTTLSPSSKATVTRRGTDTEPIFDFGIPKGEPGEENTELSESVTELYESVDGLYGTVDGLITNMNTLTVNMTTLTASVNELVHDMESIKQALNTDLTKIKDNVDSMKRIL